MKNPDYIHIDQLSDIIAGEITSGYWDELISEMISDGDFDKEIIERIKTDRIYFLSKVIS